MLNTLLQLPRPTKRIITIAIDFLVIATSFFLALWLRYDNINLVYNINTLILFSVITPITIAIFIRLGLYRAAIRYITIKIVNTVLKGTFISLGIMLLSSYLLKIEVPRTAAFLYFFLLTFSTISIRLIFRSIIQIDNRANTPVIVYGAGEAGRQLLTAINQSSEYFVIAFIDDDKKLHKTSLHGITVYSSEKLDKLIKEHQVQKILLAIPSLNLSKRQKLLNSLSKFPCEVLTVPSINDIVSGKTKISNLNKISIEDLLGREPVAPIQELLALNIKHKNIMVTGAGGSIGSELCQIGRASCRERV